MRGITVYVYNRGIVIMFIGIHTFKVLAAICVFINEMTQGSKNLRR